MNDFLDLARHMEGVELDRLEPLTTLLVWTWHSLYRVIVREGCEVVVQGGSSFLEPTPAHVEGASIGGGLLKAGWIGVGFLMELRITGQLIRTSPVVAIAKERPAPCEALAKTS